MSLLETLISMAKRQMTFYQGRKVAVLGTAQHLCGGGRRRPQLLDECLEALSAPSKNLGECRQ